MSFSKFLAQAEHKIAGSEANQWLWDYRAKTEQQFGQCILYEDVLPSELMQFADYRTNLIQKLNIHLEAKNLKPPVGAFMLILIWTSSHVHVFGAEHFYKVLCEIHDCNLEELLKTSSKPVMALPPPK